MRGLLQFVAIMTMLVEFILSSINVDYHIEAAYDNLNCRPVDAVFNAITNRIGCGALCHSKAGCHSFFYNSVDQKCYGCSSQYLYFATSYLPSQPGTKYYTTKESVPVEIPKVEITTDTYKNDLDLQWLITAPPGMIINIQFYNISIERYSSCNYDYVQVYVGPTNASQLLDKCYFSGGSGRSSSEKWSVY